MSESVKRLNLKQEEYKLKQDAFNAKFNALNMHCHRQQTFMQNLNKIVRWIRDFNQKFKKEFRP